MSEPGWPQPTAAAPGVRCRFRPAPDRGALELEDRPLLSELARIQQQASVPPEQTIVSQTYSVSDEAKGLGGSEARTLVVIVALGLVVMSFGEHAGQKPDWRWEAGMSLDSLAGRRVLVTGARGFIGSPLVAQLISVGALVHGASRTPPLNRGDGNEVSWQQVDLCDDEATSLMVESLRPDFVFHLAGATSGARDLDMVIPMLRSNLLATVNLLSALAHTGPERIVLAGSLEEPSPLDSEAVVTSPYAASKWAATGYARMLHDLWNLPVVTLRLGMIYGPGQRELYKLIPYVISCLLDGASPEVTTGTRRVDWIYIDDVVAALLAAALAPGAPGAVLDIGSGSAVAIAEITKLLTRMVSPETEVRFGTRPDRPRDGDRLADISDARRVLGWEPAVDLTTGLCRTVRWYRDLRRTGLPSDKRATQ